MNTISRYTNVVTSCLLFIVAMSMYMLTLAPSITSRHFGIDGAELAATIHTMGVPHPSGYPTYILLAKIFSIAFPWGEIAYRSNVFSAVCGAATVVTVYFLCQLITGQLFEPHKPNANHTVIASLLAAVSLSVSPLMWTQSIITEVYSLHALLISASLLATLRWYLRPFSSHKLILTSAFLIGVGMGNHMTMVFAIVPLVYVMVLTRNRISMGIAIQMLLAFIAALSVYAYLPIRASANPEINWGNSANLDGFIWMISGSAYKNLVFGLPMNELTGRLLDWPDLFVRQFNFIGILIGLLGVWSLRTLNLPLLLATTGLLLPSIVFSITYWSNGAPVYLLPAFIVIAVWISIGFYQLTTSIDIILHGSLKYRRLIYAILSLLTFLLIPSINLAINYDNISLRGNYEDLEYAQRILEQVEPNAIILAEYDREMFSLWYYSIVKQNSAGPKVLSTRLTQFNWYIEEQNSFNPSIVDISLREIDDYQSRITRLIDYNLDQRPVYITEGAALLLDRYSSEQIYGLYRLKTVKG